MRIVGGMFKGSKLAAPKGMATRPTTDRTRESLFNILSNRLDFSELRVLDLFAGTGALGLEAMSRGAEYCLFVEEASSARAALRSNIETLGLMGVTRIFKHDATRLGPLGKSAQFDLVFADPPYEKGLGEKAASGLVQGGWLNSDALFILEERSQALPETLNGFEVEDVRKFGDTSIGLFKLLN